jgi:GNAT superfamily N-acetyltransferase
MMFPTLAFLADPTDPRFDGLLRLYEAAIPARERKSEAVVRAMAGSPSQRVAIAEMDGAVAGFFLLYVGEHMALLEYLATGERLRGQGLGAWLVRAAIDAAGDRPMLVEVESDREAVPDRALRSRRIAFYRRLGCRRLSGLDFGLPLPGDGPPPWLDLLVAGARAGEVGRGQAAAWLTEIYAKVYLCDADDPRLGTMIAALPGAIPLE